jgi:hypothetical protein
MGSFSDYLENKLLNLAFKKNTYASPTNIYVGLSKSTFAGATADAYTGTSVIGEVSGGGYVRKKCNTWDTSTAGATANTAPITFAQATKDWGTVKVFFVTDKTTKGNVLIWGSLTAAKTVSSGDTLKFATQDLDATLT